MPSPSFGVAAPSVVGQPRPPLLPRFAAAVPGGVAGSERHVLEHVVSVPVTAVSEVGRTRRSGWSGLARDTLFCFSPTLLHLLLTYT